MEQNIYLHFTSMALEQTYCDECGQMIKRLDLVHPSHLLYDLNLCKKTGFICDECYHKYLIKSLNKIGITVLDENGNYKNFNDVLQEFQDVWSKQINE